MANTLSKEAQDALQQDKHWQYNKNFINWVVDVTKSSIKGGGLADDMIRHLKHKSLDTILNLKDKAKGHAHRVAHMVNACRTIRRLQ